MRFSVSALVSAAALAIGLGLATAPAEARTSVSVGIGLGGPGYYGGGYYGHRGYWGRPYWGPSAYWGPSYYGPYYGPSYGVTYIAPTYVAPSYYDQPPVYSSPGVVRVYNRDAYVSAMDGPIGQSYSWTAADSNGAVTSLRDGYSGNTYCREFRQDVTIAGRAEQAFGAACRQPDGSWKVVPNNP